VASISGEIRFEFSLTNDNATRMSDYRRGLGLVTGFIELLQNVINSNYIAITNLHTLQLTTARIKHFQSAMSSPVVDW
jgi:hypothetical protein